MPIINIKNILFNIKKARINKGLSQDQIAHELLINQKSYSKIEIGNTKITLERLSQIGDVLGTPSIRLLIAEEYELNKAVQLPEINVTKVPCNIRSSRIKRHISQYQMAARLSLSQNAYSKIERGCTHMTINHLLKIASVLEIHPMELLSEGLRQRLTAQ